MVLSTVRIEDFDRFWNTFSTKGAEKRKQHGSKGSHVFRDPNEDDRIWVLIDVDEEGYNNLMSDPEMPTLFQEADFKVGPSRRRWPASRTSRPNRDSDPSKPLGGGE